MVDPLSYFSVFLVGFFMEHDVAHGVMGRQIDPSWWTH